MTHSPVRPTSKEIEKALKKVIKRVMADNGMGPPTLSGNKELNYLIKHLSHQSFPTLDAVQLFGETLAHTIVDLARKRNQERLDGGTIRYLVRQKMMPSMIELGNETAPSDTEVREVEIITLTDQEAGVQEIALSDGIARELDLTEREAVEAITPSEVAARQVELTDLTNRETVEEFVHFEEESREVNVDLVAPTESETTEAETPFEVVARDIAPTDLTQGGVMEEIAPSEVAARDIHPIDLQPVEAVTPSEVVIGDRNLTDLADREVVEMEWEQPEPVMESTASDWEPSGTESINPEPAPVEESSPTLCQEVVEIDPLFGVMEEPETPVSIDPPSDNQAGQSDVLQSI
jgi:hypothetical protein